MSAVALVAIGGALGAGIRYVLTAYVVGHFPWAILLANVAGSFGLGVLLVSAGPSLLLFAGVGLCGALTTFSTFALDTLVLTREGRRAASAANVAVSVVGCIASLVAGLALARALGL